LYEVKHEKFLRINAKRETKLQEILMKLCVALNKSEGARALGMLKGSNNQMTTAMRGDIRFKFQILKLLLLSGPNNYPIHQYVLNDVVTSVTQQEKATDLLIHNILSLLNFRHLKNEEMAKTLQVFMKRNLMEYWLKIINNILDHNIQAIFLDNEDFRMGILDYICLAIKNYDIETRKLAATILGKFSFLTFPVLIRFLKKETMDDYTKVSRSRVCDSVGVDDSGETQRRNSEQRH
jgi:hypothetical protein